MVRVYLGMGSNLGNRRENIKKAISLLKENKIKIKKISRVIETEPVGGPQQGKFLNAVLEAETVIKPNKLLNKLKNIEKQLGRKKTVRFGPRTIDLDILLYNNAKINTKSLIVPHPRLFEREFVLKSLREIAPSLMTKIMKKAKQ